jgi:hypothetical protein
MKHILLSTFLLSLALQAEDIHIKIPKVPDVPEVKAVVPNIIIEEQTQKEKPLVQTKKTNTFSNKVAPHMQKKAEVKQKSEALAGDVIRGRVAAYLEMPAMDASLLKKTINDAGFNIKAVMQLDEKGELFSYTITNPLLLRVASKPNRGFAATLRITLDKKENLLSITNPKYLLKAFLQEEYDPKAADELLSALRKSFKKLHNSSEMIKFSAVANFVFMKGMPGYQDMRKLAQADNQRLLNKLRASKRIVFEQKLQHGAVLVGVKLSQQTAAFVEKAGYSHAALLPYPLLIENNEAKTLDPKYYIAVMYPKLKMSQFMQIAAVPDLIDKELDALFR